jgi:hypothetical protein
MKLIVDKQWRVHASHAIRLPLPASTIWGQMRDLRRFLTIDPLHKRVRSVDGRRTSISQAGDTFIIEHRVCSIGPDRLSRVLRWREGHGYAVSDLSRRGVHVGFPHVCEYDVRSINAQASLLTIAVRGRWTARFLPRPLIKLWLWWVLRSTAARIEAEFLILANVTRRQRVGALQSPCRD